MDTIDDLKRRLKRTGSQKKRRKILDEFDINLLENDFHNKERFEALKEKSRQKMSKLKLITLIGIYIYIPCYILIFISLGWTMSDDFEITFLNFIPVLIIYLASLWCMAALVIIPLLLIILLVIRRKPSYYLNIKNI